MVGDVEQEVGECTDLSRLGLPLEQLDRGANVFEAVRAQLVGRAETGVFDQRPFGANVVEERTIAVPCAHLGEGACDRECLPKEATLLRGGDDQAGVGWRLTEKLPLRGLEIVPTDHSSSIRPCGSAEERAWE